MAFALNLSSDKAGDIQAFYEEHLKCADQQNDLPHAKRSSIDITDHNDRHSQAVPAESQGFDPLDVVFIGKSYPPCRCSMHELESTLLAQLLMNHHHRGKFLLAKLVSVITVNRTITTAGIEDINGDFEVLAISPPCMNMIDGHKWPELGHWFVVREPFLTLGEYDKRPCIRIDHPSDLVDAESLAPGLRDSEPFATVLQCNRPLDPFQCKEAGNAAFLNKNLEAAYAHYSQGLLLITGDTDDSTRAVKQDLHRNRSHVRLTLGRYEGAILDAVAATTHVSDDKLMKLDVKAYFRAASASYKLKQFDRCDEFLQALLKLIPTDKGALSLLKRTKKRLDEQQQGKYNIRGIEDRIATQPHVDVADYVVNTAIGMSAPGHGRGLFATRDLKAGDLIMAETAFCHLSGDDDRVVIECVARDHSDTRISRLGLWTSVVGKMINNPAMGSEFLQLHHIQEGYGTHVDEIDGRAVVDTFQVHDMVAGNAFATPPYKENRLSSIWVRSAYINHSCIPNAERMSLGDMLLIHCTRPIAKGEEILISYIGFDRDDSRTKDLASNWGFQCDCLLCLADAKCSKTTLTHRERLVSQTRAMYKDMTPERVRTMNLFATLEFHANAIAATYDSELYLGLPTTALISIQALLLHAYIVGEDISGIDRTDQALLRTLGYVVETKNGEIGAIHATANSVIPRGATGLRWAISHQSIATHDAGNNDWSQNLLQFARSLELVDCATDTMTVEFYNDHMQPHKKIERLQAVLSQLTASD